MDNGGGFDSAGAGGFADAGAASASYDGSVSANAGDYGSASSDPYGGGGGYGGGTDSGGSSASIGASSGDLGLGGPGPMATTAADWGALSTLAATGIFAGYGMTGWSGATLAMANQVAASFGTSLNTALGHLATDIANSTAWGGMTALGSGQ
jgi:hypothetical protein